MAKVPCAGRMATKFRRGSRPRKILMLPQQCCVVSAWEWLTLRASCPMRATVEASAAAGLWLLLSGRPKYCASAITVVWPSVTCTCNQWLLLVSQILMRLDCLRLVICSQARLSGQAFRLCIMLGLFEKTSKAGYVLGGRGCRCL